MTCYHPLKGFIIGKTDKGKKKLKVVPYDVEFIPNMNWSPNNCEPIGYDEFVPIPCGQCIGCRLDYSKQWATRCMLESKYHDENYFITLTYNEDSVRHSSYIDDDGVINDILTLDKRDLQLFFKNLRIKLVRKKQREVESGINRDWTPEIRYYACGEYGSQTARPHYHFIGFGLHLDDLQYSKEFSRNGFPVYTSKFLTETWGYGNVIVGSVTYESCAYVSRYIMKKQKGEGSIVYEKYNIAPEFTVMSRRPGIAFQDFQENHFDYYPRDSIVLPGGKTCTPPRYFDSLMSEIDEELMENIKLKRRDIAESIQEYKLGLSTADYLMQLEHAENNKSRQISKLVRPVD